MEEYRQVRLLCATIAGEASACGECVQEAGRRARERINADFNVDDLHTPPCASQKLIAAATLLRAMPKPSTPEARNLRCDELIEQAAVQQAESSASRIHNQSNVWDDGDAHDQEASIHVGGTAGQPTSQGRTPVREQILDTCGQAQDGDARNVLNAKRRGDTEVRTIVGYHPRRGGRYDNQEDCSPTPEPSGTRVFSQEICTANFPQRFRQPTTITKYSRETDLECGSTTTAWLASWVAPPTTR
jgi:hypothetical protein